MAIPPFGVFTSLFKAGKRANAEERIRRKFWDLVRIAAGNVFGELKLERDGGLDQFESDIAGGMRDLDAERWRGRGNWLARRLRGGLRVKSSGGLALFDLEPDDWEDAFLSTAADAYRKADNMSSIRDRKLDGADFAWYLLRRFWMTAAGSGDPEIVRLIQASVMPGDTKGDRWKRHVPIYLPGMTGAIAGIIAGLITKADSSFDAVWIAASAVAGGGAALLAERQINLHTNSRLKRVAQHVDRMAIALLPVFSSGEAVDVPSPTAELLQRLQGRAPPTSRHQIEEAVVRVRDELGYIEGIVNADPDLFGSDLDKMIASIKLLCELTMQPDIMPNPGTYAELFGLLEYLRFNGMQTTDAIVAIGALVVVLQRRIDAFLGTDWPMSDAA